MRIHPSHLLFVVLGAAFLASCTGGQSIVPSESTSKKEDSADDDKPNDSAPVSGAYLTCYVPPPKAADEYIVGGCQVRDKDKKRVDLSKNSNVKWGFVPAKNSSLQQRIDIFDLSHAKTQRFFDAVYQLKIPPQAAASLTQGGTRVELGRYFLNSTPVLGTKLTLLSEARKQAATGPVNALGLADRSLPNFSQMSAYFPEPQSAPTTPEAMLNTSSSGQLITGETFQPFVAPPVNYDQNGQIDYQTTEDGNQNGGDFEDYTTISGVDYSQQEEGQDFPAQNQGDPYADFSEGSVNSELPAGSDNPDNSGAF